MLVTVTAADFTVGACLACVFALPFLLAFVMRPPRNT